MSSFPSVPVKITIFWLFLSTLSYAFPLCSPTSTLLSALLPTSLWFLSPGLGNGWWPVLGPEWSRS